MKFQYNITGCRLWQKQSGLVSSAMCLCTTHNNKHIFVYAGSSRASSPLLPGSGRGTAGSSAGPRGLAGSHSGPCTGQVIGYIRAYRGLTGSHSGPCTGQVIVYIRAYRGPAGSHSGPCTGQVFTVHTVRKAIKISAK